MRFVLHTSLFIRRIFSGISGLFYIKIQRFEAHTHTQREMVIVQNKVAAIKCEKSVEKLYDVSDWQKTGQRPNQ